VRSSAITLFVASQRVFIFVSVYFVIDSLRKLLVTSSYERRDTGKMLPDIRRDVDILVRFGKWAPAETNFQLFDRQYHYWIHNAQLVESLNKPVTLSPKKSSRKR
jgi:hypothetical protein